MADSFWRYNDGRQPPPQPMPPPVVGKRRKRPRPDYDVHSNHELSDNFSRDDDKGVMHGVRDTESINASYDRYLRSAQMSSFGGEQFARTTNEGMPGRPVEDPHMVGIVGLDPAASARDRALGFGGRPEVPLPPDASNTLFVERLSPNSSRREVSRILLLL